MIGDYGVIHIEVSHDLTPDEAERLSDDIAKVVFNRRWRKKDIGMSAHWDGDCEVSPHCFGAFLRRGGDDHAAE